MSPLSSRHLDRRTLLRAAALLGLAPTAARAEDIRLPLNGAPETRALTTAFPQKGAMVLQRTRPPLLETPWKVFDGGVFTPNDRFFVRWHWSVIPETIDPDAFRLAIRGHVGTPLSLGLADLRALPQVEIAAVNQCSGNSRGLFAPRVAGGQWGNGAMGNAKWTGVRLRDVLDRANIRPGAVAIRFNGLDEPPVPDAPDFMKSLAVDHARDGDVMLAWAMNGEPLPLLNGFPLRLVVPGWYSTYWVKMLNDIEVLDRPDPQYWMTSAYLIPKTPHADVKPGQTGFPTEPINRMVPRAWFTNHTDGTIPANAPIALRGIAMGGDCGVASVDLSTDGGTTWTPTQLGPDEGKFGFRLWRADLPAQAAGTTLEAMVRCTNTDRVAQPATPNWNGGGFMRNVIETLRLQAA